MLLQSDIFFLLVLLHVYPFFLFHLYHVSFYQYLSFVGSVPGFA